MWAMRLAGPETFERVEVPDLTAAGLDQGEVLLRFVTGGLCGSDTPKFKGSFDPDDPYIGVPGVPLHELVGEVVATKSDRFGVGDLAVGLVQRYRALAEYSKTANTTMVKVDPRLDVVDAIVAQPIATVLSALSTIPPAVNDRAIVLGLGPLGLLFCHILHHRGYHVTGVDRVDRSDVAGLFGIDQLVCADGRQWTAEAAGAVDAGLVVECVGHHQGLVADAVELATPTGHVIAFGLPEDEYVFPMRTFFRHHLTMQGGTTRDWQTFMALGQEHLLAHPELASKGVTHRFHPFDAQLAFELHARPKAGRLKVVLSESIPRVAAS
ncbi:MAG: zinc-binding dehydrogenase [Propionibacteriaceae bacterium]|nr:zinc-binding dehydrogenase [Propionibacteriaceae bacterium]